MTCKGTLRQVFIGRFLFGVVGNFVGSESGQIQSVKLLQNMVSNTTQHPPPPPSLYISMYILYFDFGKGGGGCGGEQELEGQ
jgi:hypothetical protein